MFHIKICGVRQPDDVRWAAKSGADAIGLNFFPPSVRYVSPDSTATLELSQTASDHGVSRIGVFVNATNQQMLQIADRVGLDAIQMHGDEAIDSLVRLRQRSGIKLIRAIKLPRGELSVDQIDELAQPWISNDVHPLFDVDAGAAHGGSGKTLDWKSIRRWGDSNPGTPFTLAGGLNPTNIAEAIEISGLNRPGAAAGSVDTASGAEKTRGIKDREQIESFVQAARKGLGI